MMDSRGSSCSSLLQPSASFLLDSLTSSEVSWRPTDRLSTALRSSRQDRTHLTLTTHRVTVFRPTISKQKMV
ncbi:hypothetical protein WMY93_011941 [Mugilogobius chulae]|uniref:Uncharacterized protein n=1 Tax=Mugilogobius chulae TaxID=88201 RepID=A0AAW0P490_9GOBI